MPKSIIMDFMLFSLTLVSELCNPKDKKVLFEIKTAFNNPYALMPYPHGNPTPTAVPTGTIGTC